MPPGFERVGFVGCRVWLRPATAADAATTYRLVTDDRIHRRLLWDGPDVEVDLVDTFGRWQRQLRHSESCGFALERLDKPGLMGCISTRLVKNPQQADIGYWLGVPFRKEPWLSDGGDWPDQ